MTATETPATVTVTVHLFFPAKPEHFAYLIPATGLYVKGSGRMVQLADVPTWSYAEKWAWYRSLGVKVTHLDGTPWTEEEWTRRIPDTEAINERIWPRRLSGI